MPTPTNKTKLQQFLGMVTYLSKFIPDLSLKTTHLRQLLESTVEWNWSEYQEKAFKGLKTEISLSPTLNYYDPQLETMLSVDASKYGLGAVLLQENETWDPVAYASRSLTKTEQNYEQMEKETLAIVFGTQRFHDIRTCQTLHCGIKPQTTATDFYEANRKCTTTYPEIQAQTLEI